jgi:hypothetical protein
MITSTSRIRKYASSSIGRVAVSKTVGWGFESLLACLTADAVKKLQSYTAKEGHEADAFVTL